MAQVREIVVPETEPASEWVGGRVVRKMSPRRTHAVLQLAFAASLKAWAAGRGWVGTEWRFRVAPPGEPRRPLVPDIAYVSYARVPRESAGDPEFEAPPLAPELAVEILSPGDRAEILAEKIRVYLAAGSLLVLVLDPKRRLLVAHSASGVRTFAEGSTFTDPSLPGYLLDLRALFAETSPPQE
ncbi:MAG: Uma2 family endonuclease [Vulcanimicrobiaceae bacterium]